MWNSEECVIPKSSCKKKHVTIDLSATADAKMLPPTIIFKGITEKTNTRSRGIRHQNAREDVDEWTTNTRLVGGYWVKT